MKLFASFGLLLLPFLFGCVTPASVDFDRAAIPQMIGYESFQIDSRYKRSNAEAVALSPIVDRRIERAIRATLQEKGFQAVPEAPDFCVSFNTVSKTRTELNDYSPPIFRRPPYHGYGRRYLDLDQYEEGTFIIDIFDSKTQQLVWRGASTKRLGWTAPNLDEVNEIVGLILADFPPGIATGN